MQKKNQILCTELMDIKEIQKFQNVLSKVSNVAIACFDANNKQVTSISGKPSEIESFLDGERKNTILRLLDASYADKTEEQVIERVGDRKLAVVNIFEQNTIFMRFAVMSPAGAGNEFEEVLDLLRVGSQSIIRGYMDSYVAIQEQMKSRKELEDNDREMQAAKATMEIVQLIDSDEEIEKVLEQAVTILCGHMKVSGVGIFQGNPEETQWKLVAGSQIAESKLMEFPFDRLKTDKPVVHSTDSIGQSIFASQMQKLGIRAVMVFPLISQPQAGKMLLALSQVDRKRTFSVNEVKYISDTVRLIQNILTRRIQKNSLASSYEVLQSIMNSVGSAVYVRDAVSGEHLFAGRNLQQMFPTEIEGGQLDRLIDESAKQKAEEKEFDAEQPRSKEIFCNENGKWFDLRQNNIIWVDGRDAELYSFYDISEKKIYQRKIEQQTSMDFLTGLYNRTSCERDLKKHVTKAEKKGSIGALLYMDLDDFKHINDALGHQYGDILLQSIAKAIRSIKGLENNCYRMGGDEFVMIVPPGNYDRLEGILEDLKKIFNCPWYVKESDYYCTMSMGVITFPELGSDVHELIRKADVAMYAAKQAGKNQIVWYTENMDSNPERRLDMEKSMREAIETGYKEFQIYFQPLMQLNEDGKTTCIGAEALLRWESHQMGFMNPNDFIPLAEYLGLINPIGDYVMLQACKYCKSWNDAGFPDFEVSVNLSVAQLLQDDIVDDIKSILKQSGIKPQNLILEVTESLAINDMDRMSMVLSKIKKLGVKIALDDFGTGYSSLNYIREMPLDIIKVDQGFVRDLSWDPYSQSFLRLVADLGEALEVTICTEGVENRKQLQSIQQLKIKYAQGFFFEKPLPADKFEKKYVTPLKKNSEK